jgi:hypothetical protein
MAGVNGKGNAVFPIMLFCGKQKKSGLSCHTIKKGKHIDDLSSEVI